MTPIDPENPVVKLCAQGMEAEGQGRQDDARLAFGQAWDISLDDFEACIAAHYLARHQPSDEETAHWNREALVRADAVADDRVDGLYPSLLLNMGHSCETLGQKLEARRYYKAAEQHMGSLPASPYTELVRRGILQGIQRTAG